MLILCFRLDLKHRPTSDYQLCCVGPGDLRFWTLNPTTAKLTAERVSERDRRVERTGNEEGRKGETELPELMRWMDGWEREILREAKHRRFWPLNPTSPKLTAERVRRANSKNKERMEKERSRAASGSRLFPFVFLRSSFRFFSSFYLHLCVDGSLGFNWFLSAILHVRDTHDDEDKDDEDEDDEEDQEEDQEEKEDIKENGRKRRRMF